MQGRVFGGAPILSLPLNRPGFFGLNLQEQSAILGPQWATRLSNTVFDDRGLVSARKGWSQRTTVGLGHQIDQMFEFFNETTSTYEVIVVTDNNTIHKSTDAGESFSDVTGTATVTDSNMKLVQFAGNLLGFQNGDVPISYNGTTSSDNSSSGIPQTNVALAAFGRIWAKDSASVVKYCALLDATDWTGSDTGAIDLTSVWKDQDEIIALEEFAGNLVIFGRRNVVIYGDSAGSALGVDPTQIFVKDLITNVGAVGRDAVATMKGDLWFLDDNGLQSLGRLVDTEANPLNGISRNVQDALITDIANTDAAEIRAQYVPSERFFLLSMSAGSATAESGVVYCFDTQAQLEGGQYRVTGRWSGNVPRAMLPTDGNELLLALKEQEGLVGVYDGYDDAGTAYQMEYESGWSQLSDDPEVSIRYKILKQINAVLYIQDEATVTFKWAFDFIPQFRTAQVTFPRNSTGAAYGIEEFGVAEFAGGERPFEKKAPGGGYGEYIKVGMTVPVSTNPVSIQQMSTYSKIGRPR